MSTECRGPHSETKIVELLAIDGVFEKDGELAFNHSATQSRAQFNAEAIEDYADHLADMPAVALFWDGKKYWIGDGHHTIKAAISKKQWTIKADVRPGDRRDAVLFSVGANAKHDIAGLRRTNADKRAAVALLLTDKEWSQWSNRKIADQCHVSPSLVGTLSDLRFTDENKEDVRKFERGGSVSRMRTRRIGRRKKTVAEKMSGLSPDKQRKMMEKAGQRYVRCPNCKHRFPLPEE